MRVQNLVEDELVTSPEVTVGKKEEINFGDAERIEDGVAETTWVWDRNRTKVEDELVSCTKGSLSFMKILEPDLCFFIIRFT